ncbi:hypothetical protein PsYK624_028940 [Phanerochaete sordida]|uniref:Translation machinery associated TMA7 n=1 Tax=Phanerochaete sordida TaxID=48140 RepID=A0A9P3G212_9APHY|nr:hypothetical protein PsYK624_028940 [Phanerochaete sordida]
MSGRQGGKLKPLKAPKKDKKDEDEEDLAFKKRKQEEAAALKAAKDKALKGSTRRWNQEVWQEVETSPAPSAIQLLLAHMLLSTLPRLLSAVPHTQYQSSLRKSHCTVCKTLNYRATIRMLAAQTVRML